MSSNCTRVQLLANLKCLYGSSVEVLTLRIPNDAYQALATSFDPITATWTKLLHSDPYITSRDAIDALLKMSEKELGELLSTSGYTFPFQGVMEQTLTLRRGGRQRDSSSEHSLRSHPIVIATPALPDTGSAEHLVPASGKPQVDKAPVQETVIGYTNDPMHPPPEEEPTEQHWSGWGVTKPKKNGGQKADLEPPVVEPNMGEPVPLEDEWSFSKKKDKKKRGKSDIVEEQMKEPAEPAAYDLVWASLSKKDAKKKGKAVVEEPPMAEEPVEAIDPELQEDYMGWAPSWGKKDKNKGKNMPIESIDETPAPDPVLASDAEDDWGTWGTSKKDKRGKGKVINEDLPRTPTPHTPPQIKSVLDPKLDEIPPSSPLPSLPSPSASKSAQLTQTHRTVVFTIKLPNELSDKSLQVMTIIADDTRTAIIESVNSYLDLQRIPKGIQGHRKVNIKYGVGRNGNIDVSTLEETMWPQYLNYFCQYTSIPELTVEVMEC